MVKRPEKSSQSTAFCRKRGSFFATFTDVRSPILSSFFKCWGFAPNPMLGGFAPQTPHLVPSYYFLFDPLRGCVGASPQTPPGGYAPWTPNTSCFIFNSPSLRSDDFASQNVCWGFAPNPTTSEQKPLRGFCSSLLFVVVVF